MTDSLHDETDPLAFTPVTVRTRSDGWTPDRQRKFIQALAAWAWWPPAARSVGKSATAAYKLRERPGAESFGLAWDIAQTMAGDRAFYQAVDRATNGVEMPRFYKGVQVATVRRPDHRLALKVLDHHLPDPAPAIDFQTALALIADGPA